jgi:hypothetical protein
MSSTLPLYKQILKIASTHLTNFKGDIVDVVDILVPKDLDYAIHLSKVISKLSPMLGNIIEYRVVVALNQLENWPIGKWKRQDPGFPDTIFEGSVKPQPCIEIKTWCPLATEMTARFKDSMTLFENNQTNVAMLVWLPENVIFGKPKIIDVWVDSAKSVALARDRHYHNPPDYIVFEPEDTSHRTRNLQQTNTNGYVFQGTKEELAEAELIVSTWGVEGKQFSSARQYQNKLRSLLGRFSYRLYTNFAKMDRINHTSLEIFKNKVFKIEIHGLTIGEWVRIIRHIDKRKNQEILKTLVNL